MPSSHPHPNPDKPQGGEGFVTVIYDVDKTFSIHPGVWQVDKLKKELGAPEAEILAEVTAQGLNDLADGGQIKVFEGQKFASHGRGGASS